MKRPWLLEVLPLRLKMSLLYRWYGPRADQWTDLFQRVPLALTPSVSMHDLVPHDAISTPIAFTGMYEPEFAKQLFALARQGGVMVDVGANMGYFTLLWAAANKENHVISFEPDRRCLQRLRRNVDANELSRQVDIVDKACSDQAGEIEFTLADGAQTGWQGIAPKGAGSATVTVVATTLDAIFQGRDTTVDVLKIDTEGADTLVLRGAEKMLASARIRRVFFEQNTTRMRQLGLEPSEAREILERHGYRVSTMSGNDFNWAAVAPGVV